MLEIFYVLNTKPQQIYPDDNVSITMDGPIHKLVIMKCSEDNSGKYRFEADGRKTEAMMSIRGLCIHQGIE